MTVHETFSERLRGLQSKCRPGHFSFLFALVEEFAEIGKLFPQLETQLLPHSVLHYVQTQIAINAAINGSQQRLLLEDIGFSQPEDKEEGKRWTVGRGLGTSQARYRYLTLTTNVLVVLVCAGVLKRAPVAQAWKSLARATLDVPALGLLARGIDIAAMCQAQAQENFADAFRPFGFEVIDLTLPEHVLIQAGGELVSGVNAGFTGAGLQNCRANLELILSFLLRTEGSNWSLGPFRAIAPEISLTAIVSELVSHRLKRLSATSSPLREATERRQLLWMEGMNSFYVLRPGIFRRDQFLAILPLCAYLSRTLNSDDLNAWQADPLHFLKQHIVDIPHSVAVDNLRLRLERVRSLQIDLEAQGLAVKFANHATAEGLALVACRTVGLPNDASFFLTPIFEPLIEKLNIWG